MSFNTLVPYLKKYPELQAERIRSAYNIAAQAHANQTRLSGDPYITHPVAVSIILLEAGGDEDIVCAALLHDTIEDADDPISTANLIQEKLGKHVYFMVEALSKNKLILESEVRHQDFIEQLEAAFKLDTGVFFIKLADLLHNLESIELLKPEKKVKWLRELQHDYFPVLSDYFHRLSIYYHPMYHQLMDQFEKIVSTKI